MTIGFLFGGQGSQVEGMGIDFVETYPEVKELYQKAENILGYNLLTLPQTQLNQTRYAQPAIYTLGCAIQLLLKQAHITPSAVAGLSLGEYNALHCANSISFEEGLRLLINRAKFMDEACAEHATSMVAILSDDRQLIETLCQYVSQQGDLVYLANYNAPGQIVVGGYLNGIAQLKEKLLEHGIKRIIPLSVSGAFHTPFMQSATEKLSPFLKATPFKKTECLVIGNTLAKAIDYHDLPILLEKQIVSPVYFADTIKEMLALGVTKFIEIGPKPVLSQFVKKVDKRVTTYTISSVEQLKSMGEHVR